MLGKDVKVFTGASARPCSRGSPRTEGGVRQDVVRPEGRVQADREPTGPGGVRQGWCEPPESEKQKCGSAASVFGWSECNFKFLNALDAMAADANLSSATPRTWTEEIRAFLPAGGYGEGTDAGEPDPSAGAKVENVKAQFYEPAPASPWRRSSPRARLSACWTSRGASTTRISCGARCSTCCSASRTGTGRTCSSPRRRGASWSSTTRGRSARSTPCCSPGAVVRGVPHRVQRRVLREPSRRQGEELPGQAQRHERARGVGGLPVPRAFALRRHRAASRRRALPAPRRRDE